MNLDMAIRPSRVYGAALVIIYMGVLLLLCVLPMSLWFRSALLVGYLVCLWSAWRDWRSQETVTRLTLEQGRLGVFLAGRYHRVAVGKSTLIHPWLVILPVRNASMRKTLLLFPDTACADDLRRLRVWLKGGLKESK